MAEKTDRLPMVERDEWLVPVAGEIEARHRRYLDRLRTLTGSGGDPDPKDDPGPGDDPGSGGDSYYDYDSGLGGDPDPGGGGTLSDFANGYKWFGFQRDDTLAGLWFREWLPEARDVFLFGDFNDWQRTELRLEKGAGGVWSIFLPDALYADRLIHGSLYKIHVHGADGEWRDRIPAYARRVVQNDETKDYTAQFWDPTPFDWGGDVGKNAIFRDDTPVFEGGYGKKPDIFGVYPPLLIYEAHVGMSQEKEGVGTYTEFAENVLPRIAAEGYNTLQLMAVAEHPYYGSFGYHVSNFFAVSSRSGTPEELKALIKRAHDMGIAVVMDLVHAHYVKNINEGLARLDGSDRQYSKPGEAGYQKYWDSLLFDYGKTEVTHFLLSNVKFWLDEFRFDGFRFDGVTSMIYHHHGYTEFDSRDKFFGPDVNTDALTYLTLANHLVHEFRSGAVTIAEDVSGMPGMALPIADGGVGFDYRLGMAIPDFWIKMLKEVPDEQWNVWDIWNIMTDRLPDVKTVAYAESHDQALVGDKTIAFRLMDAAMYTSMARGVENMQVERGMALHKMIRLVTIAAGGNAYLNFMGNEFGHPEWIDFPREGNGWSYSHARRQWSLADSPFLRYSQLLAFDEAMIAAVKEYGVLCENYPRRLQMDEGAQTMVFSRGCVPHGQFAGSADQACSGARDDGGNGELVFVFNWHPSRSTADYVIEVPEAGRYRLLLSTDEERFGGLGRQTSYDPAATDHFTFEADGRHYMQIYNICRTAAVFVKI